MPTSTASDAAPAISQVFRMRKPTGAAGATGGAFGTRTTGGATGSIRAAPVATGLFIAQIPLPPSGVHPNARRGTGFDAYQTVTKTNDSGQNGPAGVAASRLQLGIPIKIVEPAFVQIIRRKRSPIAVQVLHCGLERHLRGPHLG